MKLRSFRIYLAQSTAGAVACCVLVALVALGATRAQGGQVAFVQVPRLASDGVGGGIANSILADRYLVGMRVAVAEVADIAASVQVVTQDFVCATDPAFSPDGTRLIFCGKRSPSDPLRIWELTERQPQPRLITSGDSDCVTPAQLANGGIVFASLASREYEEHGGRFSFSLYAHQIGADAPTRLTFNPSSDFDPAALPDGRVLYSSWQHVGNHHWPRGTVGLMLINADGTGVFPLTGNHRGPWLKRGSRPLDGDRVAFIQSDRFSEFGAGELVVTRLNDPFSAYEILVPKERFVVSGVAGLSDGRLLLSARPADGTRATFGLYIYEKGAVRLLYDDPESHELAPAVADGVRLESRFSTVVPGTLHGYLAVLNCYETDRNDQHPVRKDTIKAVRVIEGRPLRYDGTPGPAFLASAHGEAEPLVHPASATGYIPSRVLGEVPPAPDGSIYLKVPADRPLRLQLIDQDGFAVMNERAWFWVRPNERRVCIGCHANRELSPSNAVPLATRRAPTDLTDPSGWQTVSFRKDIHPIVRANCAVSDCHVPPTPTAGMNLSAERLWGGGDAAYADRFGPPYANLLARQENKPIEIGGRRVHPGDARSSPLLWMLYGRALAPQYKPAPFERPMLAAHPGPMLPQAQLELIRKWVDLGAIFEEESPFGPWPYDLYRPPAVVMESTPDAR